MFHCRLVLVWLIIWDKCSENHVHMQACDGIKLENGEFKLSELQIELIGLARSFFKQALITLKQ